jgi:hypothetical protein
MRAGCATGSAPYHTRHGRGRELSLLNRPRRAWRGFLELGIFSGDMPEMQNFNCSPVVVQTIVDIEWRSRLS